MAAKGCLNDEAFDRIEPRPIPQGDFPFTREEARDRDANRRRIAAESAGCSRFAVQVDQAIAAFFESGSWFEADDRAHFIIEQ